MRLLKRVAALAAAGVLAATAVGVGALAQTVNVTQAVPASVGAEGLPMLKASSVPDCQFATYANEPDTATENGVLPVAVLPANVGAAGLLTLKTCSVLDW